MMLSLLLAAYVITALFAYTTQCWVDDQRAERSNLGQFYDKKQVRQIMLVNLLASGIPVAGFLMAIVFVLIETGRLPYNFRWSVRPSSYHGGPKR